MGFIEGDARPQGTLFPVTLEELIPEDHVCRVLDAFVDRLDMQKWDSSGRKRPRQGVRDTIHGTY